MPVFVHLKADEPCAKNWWIDFLYLNNFIRYEHQVNSNHPRDSVKPFSASVLSRILVPLNRSTNVSLCPRCADTICLQPLTRDHIGPADSGHLNRRQRLHRRVSLFSAHRLRLRQHGSQDDH